LSLSDQAGAVSDGQGEVARKPHDDACLNGQSGVVADADVVADDERAVGSPPSRVRRDVPTDIRRPTDTYQHNGTDQQSDAHPSEHSSQPP